MTAVKWWPGDKAMGIRPAVSLTTRRKQYVLRFGRDDRAMFSERYSGVSGVPKMYWYGPFGLTLRIREVQS